ncbi:MAG: DMT family transporter [Oscillospiraceae bacterium]|nr:DMT family transporter [Oscillospiraceae bacterium]
MSKQGKANLMLIAAAMIWGAAFVAQSAGMEYVRPCTFQACRCVLGGLVLLPVLALRRDRTEAAAAPKSRKDLWIAGILCGVILFAGSTLQQYGLLYTSAGKSGFLTALYVVLLPVASLLLGKRAPLTVWLGVAMAAAALYLLCVNEQFTVGRGELLTLGCAACFTLHILVIDHFSRRVDGVALSCIQFFVCGALAAVGMLIFERPSWAAILRCWLPICYAGILSCGGGYTLQILGQKHAKPTVASLLMSLESVFAVLFGALLLRERLRPAEYAGCVLMFAAIVLAQLPQRKRASKT